MYNLRLKCRPFFYYIVEIYKATYNVTFSSSNKDYETFAYVDG